MSTIQEPFANTCFLISLGPHTCGDQVVYQANGLTYADL